MKLTAFWFCLSCCCCTSLAVQAQTGSSLGSPNRFNDSGTLQLDNCTVVLIQDIDLPALESGQIVGISAKPGDHIKVGQHLAQLDDTRSQRALEEATLRHEIAESQADDSTKVEAAYRRAQLAQAESAKMSKLNQSGSVSEQLSERARVTKEIAILEYQSSKKEKELARLESAAEMVTVKASQDSINRHNLKSPINGIVYQIDRQQGEWVTAGETVMKIAQMDRLRIHSIVDGNQYDSHEIANRPVTVTAVLARGQEIQFQGSIVFVDLTRGGKNEFFVWADVENRLVEGTDRHWLLQPGANVTMRIHLDQPIAQSASITGQNR